MLRGLVFVPPDTKVPFIAWQRATIFLSLALVLASVVLVAVKGLNFGIDFQGGLLIEIRTQGPADIGDLRRRLGGLGLGEVTLQEFGEPNDVLIRVQKQEGGEAAQQRAVAKVKDALGPGIEYRRTEFVGPQVSEELLLDGIYATLGALAAILVYVWFRFEWQFALSGVIALLHDVITTIGLFAFLGLEFNLTTVAALLTIAGYSINDTVVIFDRVRENLRKYKRMPLPELLNFSNNQTLSRTVNTGVTTMLSLAALMVLGGEVIRGFCIALLWGVAIGTYSSVCLAVPLLLYLNVRREALAPEESQEGPAGAAG